MRCTSPIFTPDEGERGDKIWKQKMGGKKKETCTMNQMLITDCTDIFASKMTLYNGVNERRNCFYDFGMVLSL